MHQLGCVSSAYSAPRRSEHTRVIEAIDDGICDTKVSGCSTRRSQGASRCHARGPGVPASVLRPSGRPTPSGGPIGTPRLPGDPGYAPSGVMVNSRTDTVLPKHGPTDGADSIPE